MVTLDSLYGKVKERLDKNGKGLACDYDDTTFGTNHYFARCLTKAYPDPDGLTPEEIVQKYRFASQVPYWQKQFIHSWRESHILSDRQMLKIPLLEGALEGITAVNEIIPVNPYFTARPEDRREGCRIATVENRLPNHSRAIIILSPPLYYQEEIFRELGVDDLDHWKAKVLEFLYPEVSGHIDDSFGVASRLNHDYPGTLYLYSHSTAPNSSKAVVPCPTWRDVVSEVRKREGR